MFAIEQEINQPSMHPNEWEISEASISTFRAVNAKLAKRDVGTTARQDFSPFP